MAEQSWWIGADRETFHRVAHDRHRIERLQNDRSFHAQSGWAEEVSLRRAPKPEWTPPAKRATPMAGL